MCLDYVEFFRFSVSQKKDIPAGVADMSDYG